MRTTLITMGLLIQALWTYAQKELPAYGKIDNAEFAIKQCDYDPDAEAEILLNTADMMFTVSTNIVSTEVTYRVRVKILKEKGVDRGNIRIPYYHPTNASNISKIEGTTYNMDASGAVTATKLEKSTVYDKKIDKYWSEVVFSLPSVKVGSIIEYRYRHFSLGFGVSSWNFQQDVPVRLSCYKVQWPEQLKFTEKSNAWQPVDVKTDESGGLVYKTYIMRNIPGLRHEPFMASTKDYQEKLDFALIGIQLRNEPYQAYNRTWRAQGEALLEDEDFGSVLKKNLSLPADFKATLASMKTPYDKMIAIHNYVRHNMTWNEKYSIWALDGIKKSWEKRNGNSGEINLIMINLMKDADLEVYPLMVSTRDNGRVNTLYPDLGTFNTVMAYVQIGESYYILDGTDKFTPPSMVPHSVANTEGLVVISKKSSEWLTLTPANQRYRMAVLMSGEVKPDGNLQGEARVVSYGYSRCERVKTYTQGKDKFTDTYFAHSSPNIKIENIDVVNADNDSLPLEQVVKFNLPMTNTGEYNYFSPNLFMGLETNSFIADKRSSDVDFGYNQSYTMVGSFSIPEGFEVEELPKNKRMIMPDTTITLLRIMEFTDHKVNVRVNLEFTQPIYSIDNYEYFQQFYKLLFDTLNEQIVIRRKKA